MGVPAPTFRDAMAATAPTPAPSKPVPQLNETLTMLELHDWVRKRPDTFLGATEPVAELRWVVGEESTLEPLFGQPITSISEKDANKLRKQEVHVIRPALADPVEDPDDDGDGGVGPPDGTTDPLPPPTPSFVHGDGDDEEKEKKEEDGGDDDGDRDASSKPKAGKAKAGRAKPATKGAAVRVLVEVRPAAEKIVDEILQNVADRPVKDGLMKRIDVWVDETSGTITVRNDGHGIPVTKPDPVVNPKAGDDLWPTILFTKSMAGGNFEEVEGQAHHQGGRNGIGAKAANICSTAFTVTVGDCVNRKHFTQTWTNGMKDTTGPKVKSYARAVGFVEVCFRPDMAFFKEAPGVFSPTFAALIRSRVWELAAVTPEHIAVYLDGAKLPVKNLTQFTSLFHGGSSRPARSLQVHNGHTVLDITVLPAVEGHTPSDFLGFVNGIRCSNGKHLQHIFGKLVDMVEPVVLRRLKPLLQEAAKAASKDKKDGGGGGVRPAAPGAVIKQSDVRACTFVVAALRIDKPVFTSQTKDTLDSAPGSWGFKWAPDPAFVKRVETLVARPVADKIAQQTVSSTLQKGEKAAVAAAGGAKGKVNLSKYEPAGDAGKPNTQAWLVLAEGDSAMTTAMAGRATVGASKMGVYCLKGKPMNPRDAPLTRVLADEVLRSVAAILGLRPGVDYSDPKALATLKYRHVFMLADQDLDGGHIVGLVVNWLETMWPSLLVARPDFVKRFATPIVVARPKRAHVTTRGPDPVRFLSLPTFKQWLVEDVTRQEAYEFQYYKGLGGHDAAAARDYFRDVPGHSIVLEYRGAEDHEMLLNFYDKTRADVRKRLLLEVFDEEACVDYSQASIPIADFLVKETLPYGNDHNIRNIPGVDGLKRTQRKLLYAMRTLVAPGKSEKLQTLAMKAAALTNYHHGDVSVYSTTVGMGQTHIGTNNLNLLMCNGNFGSRKDSRQKFAAPRYLFTGVMPIVAKLFRPEDDAALVYRVEDGSDTVEPVAFAPVVPIDLLNGCAGVGTGWATIIPSYNPYEVAEVFRLRVQGDPRWAARANAMVPWYDGFTGPIVATRTRVFTYGLYHLQPGTASGTTQVVISDLPIGTWTTKYHDTVLLPLATPTDKVPTPLIQDILSETTDTRIRYTLVCSTAMLEPYLTVDPADAGGGGDPKAKAKPRRKAVGASAGTKKSTGTKKSKGKASGGDGDGDADAGADAADADADQDLDEDAVREAAEALVVGTGDGECDGAGAAAAAAAATPAEDPSAPFVPDARGFRNSADVSVLDQAKAVYDLRQPRYPKLEAVLQLRQSSTLQLMNRFDAAGKIVLYKELAALVESYYQYRIPVYVARFETQAENLRRDILRQENRVKFLRAILDGVMVPKAYKTVKAWWQDLGVRGFNHDKDPAIAHLPLRTSIDLPVTTTITKVDKEGGGGGSGGNSAKSAEDVDDEEDGDASGHAFTYLTNQYVSTLTEKKFGAEEEKLRWLQDKLAEVLKQSPSAVWDRELEEFQAAYVGQFMESRVTANAIKHDDIAADKPSGKKKTGVKRGVSGSSDAGVAAPKTKKATLPAAKRVKAVA